MALLAVSLSSPKRSSSITEIQFISSQPKTETAVQQTVAPPRKAFPKSVPTISPEKTTISPATSDLALETSAETSGADTVGIESYESEVARLLNARKSYPEAARRLRQQGRVKVAFEIDRSGTVLSVAMIEASPHSLLNEAAQKLIREIKRFNAFPADVKASAWRFIVPIEYKM